MEEEYQDVRVQRLDAEVVTIEVVTMVDVEIDVVVVEDVFVDGVLVVDVVDILVDEDVGEELVVDTVVVSVVVVEEVVVGVDSVDITEDVEDEIAVVVGMEVVDTVDGVIDTVRVELSIGKNLTAFTAVILEITPATARKRISVNAISAATDFIQLSLLPQNRMAHFLPRACEHGHRCSILTTGCSSI